MANVIISDTHLMNIASAIRTKNGSADTYKPNEMAAAIRAIEIGGNSGSSNVGATVELRAYVNDTYVNGDNCAKDIVSSVVTGANVYDLTGLYDCPRLKEIDISTCATGCYFWPVYNCPELEKVIFPNITTNSDVNVYIWNSVDLTDFPFMNCPKLKTLIFPGGAQFGNNVGIGSSVEKVYFRGKPAYDYFDTWAKNGSYTFFLANFPELTDVYVPWAQGEIKNERGTTDLLENLKSNGVNIHYNYVFTGNE